MLELVLARATATVLSVALRVLGWFARHLLFTLWSNFLLVNLLRCATFVLGWLSRVNRVYLRSPAASLLLVTFSFLLCDNLTVHAGERVLLGLGGFLLRGRHFLVFLLWCHVLFRVLLLSCDVCVETFLGRF